MRYRLILLIGFLGAGVSVYGDESYLDHVYQQGQSARAAGDRLSSLNSWFKYIEVARRLDPDVSASRLKEVNQFYSTARQEAKGTEPALAPVAESQPLTPLQPAGRKKRLIQKLNRLPSHPSPNPALSARLVHQAEKAVQSGHYEEAKRFYGLALQLNLESETIRGKIQELEKILK